VKKPLILSLFHPQKKTQTFSPIPLIVIKTFVPSTPSINHQKPKTKNHPQKQAKTTKTQKPFSFPFPSLGRPNHQPTLLEIDIPPSQSLSRSKIKRPRKPFPSFLLSFSTFDPLISFLLSLPLSLSSSLSSSQKPFDQRLSH
jgi:hypothetical protein